MENVLTTRSELPLPYLESRNLQFSQSSALGKKSYTSGHPPRSSTDFQIMDYWGWRLLHFYKTDESAGSSLEKP